MLKYQFYDFSPFFYSFFFFSKTFETKMEVSLESINGRCAILGVKLCINDPDHARLLGEEIVNISQTWRKLCQTIFIIVLKQRCPLIDLVSVSVKSSGAAVTLCQINSHDKPCRQLACMHVYRMNSTLAHRNTGNFLFKMIYLQHVFMLGFVF